MLLLLLRPTVYPPTTVAIAISITIIAITITIIAISITIIAITGVVGSYCTAVAIAPYYYY